MDLIFVFSVFFAVGVDEQIFIVLERGFEHILLPRQRRLFSTANNGTYIPILKRNLHKSSQECADRKPLIAMVVLIVTYVAQPQKPKMLK